MTVQQTADEINTMTREGEFKKCHLLLFKMAWLKPFIYRPLLARYLEN